MSRLNPIYILALIVTLFIISISMLNNKKESFIFLQQDYNSTNQKAKNFREYKNTWFNEKQIRKRLDRILKSSSFRKEKILKTQNENMIRVKIESDNPRILDKFLNRILNEKFIFKKLNIQKRSISFEIGLKK